MDKAVIKQKVHHDQGAELFPFMEGDEVWVQRPTSKGYDEGVVVRWTGDLSYLVDRRPSKKEACRSAEDKDGIRAGYVKGN